MNRKTLTILISVIAVVLAIMAFAVYIYFFSNRSFDSYDVISEWKRKDSNTVQYLMYGDNYLKYSRDGASAFDSSGKVIWNGGYAMDSPCADICGDYVVIYNIGGKECYVYNGKDSGIKVETALPIVKARVAGQGVVAVLLEDTDSNTINIYNPYSSATPLVVEIPTNITENGYPMDFDISEDGNSLVASYLIVKKGKAVNQISFYNFTEVGQDKNRLVGGKSFENNMITRIEFFGNDEVIVFYQNGFSVFEDMKQPKETVKKTFEEKIQSVVVNEKHIGIIINNADNEKRTLHLFSHSGKTELTFPISYDFEKVICSKDELIFYNNKRCNILRYNGTEKFKFAFDHNIQYFLPGGGGNQYLMIDEYLLQQIKLSGG